MLAQVCTWVISTRNLHLKFDVQSYTIDDTESLIACSFEKQKQQVVWALTQFEDTTSKGLLYMLPTIPASQKTTLIVKI